MFSTLTTLAVLIRIVANPLANVFQKQLTHRAAHPLFIMAATYGFLTIACVVVGADVQFRDLPTSFWPTMLVVGLAGMLGNVWLVRALHLGDLSVLGPINAYKSVVGLIIAVFLLHEVPGWWGLAGVLLIVAGSYVVLHQPAQPVTWSTFLRPAVRLRLLALIFSAIDGVFLKKAILLTNPTVAFFYWCLLGFVFALIWLLLTRQTQWRVQVGLLRTQWVTYLLLFVAVGVTQLTSNVVLASMPVGYALALFQLSALVSVVLGYQFFRETDIPRKLLGAGIMVAGAVLITVLG